MQSNSTTSLTLNTLSCNVYKYVLQLITDALYFIFFVLPFKNNLIGQCNPCLQSFEINKNTFCNEKLNVLVTNFFSIKSMMTLKCICSIVIQFKQYIILNVHGGYVILYITRCNVHTLYT